MHYRFLVTFDTRHAKTSDEAREYVYTTLHDEGFCSQGRFGGGYADWFVIGGRWSGALTRAMLDQEKLKAVEKEFEEKHGWFLGGKEGITEEQRRAQMQAIFKRHFPKYHTAMEVITGVPNLEIPYWRNNYRENGYDDDAMLLNKELFDRLLKDNEGDISDRHADLDYDDVSPDIVGRKWLVVVDYHN